jgi:hypothetical protein
LGEGRGKTYIFGSNEVLWKKYDEVYSRLNNNDQGAWYSKLRKVIKE